MPLCSKFLYLFKAAPAGPLIWPSSCRTARRGRAAGAGPAWRFDEGQAAPQPPQEEEEHALAGQAGSGMTSSRVGTVTLAGWGGLVVIPSPDLMAITPRRDRKLWQIRPADGSYVAAPARRDRDAIRRRDDHQATLGEHFNDTPLKC